MASSHNNTSGSSSSSCTSPSPLCSKGCGFHGSTATRNMCSKCYKDFLKQSEDQLKLLTIAEKPTTVDILSPGGHVLDNSSTDASAESSSRSKKNRCQCCNKRVGLTGFGCRCGGMFCGLHRYPEEHGCGFDFKAFGRAALLRQNPLCNGDKMLERA